MPAWATSQHKTRAQIWNEASPASVPGAIQAALREALALEQVCTSQFDDFLWLIAQESGGRVNAVHAHSTARGLFQLLRPHYRLNPQGEQSFGNATEECQGGIRYVMRRHRSARAACDFWLAHHWY